MELSRPSESKSKKLKTDKDHVPPDDEEKGSKNGSSSSSKEPTTSSISPGAPAAAVMNPLENVVILEHLFKLCDRKLLANCRLVSKQWYQESLLPWRASSSITFSQDEYNQNRLCLISSISDSNPEAESNFNPLKEFLTYVDDPTNKCRSKPFRCVKLFFCDFSVNPEHFEQLMNAVGSHITSLHLITCAFGEAEQFRKIIFIGCPNLQTLDMGDSTCFGPDRRNQISMEEKESSEYRDGEPRYGKQKQLKTFQGTPSIPISWLEFFSHFQSLEYFSIVEFKIEKDFERLLYAIKSVRKQDPKALPFKCFGTGEWLDISQCNPISQKLTRLVQELRLPLKNLLIKVKRGMDEVAVRDLLESHAKTVKEIQLDGPSFVFSQPFPFGVQLDALTTLIIREHLCDTLAFLKYTPNLEQLTICGKETKQTKIISKKCQKEIANVRMADLGKLRLDCIVTDQGLSSLFEWMPNLTSLEMNLHDNQFEIVCGKWKNLTSLKVIGQPLTEAELTGIENLGRKRKASRDEQGGIMEATRPNITHLQNLEEFTFRSEKLTDISVFHGFSQLPRLQRIECHTNNLCWGKEAREVLENKKVWFYQHVS